MARGGWGPRSEERTENKRYGDCPVGAHGMHNWVATDESGKESECMWCSAKTSRG